MLLSNAGVAFLLNVAAVFLVGVGSGLVLTLAGVLKDILLITGSVLLFGSVVTPLQVFGGLLAYFLDCFVAFVLWARLTRFGAGYSIALGGLVLFKTSGGK